jgi:hypothetical protein
METIGETMFFMIYHDIRVLVEAIVPSTPITRETARGSRADLRVVFAFFSNRLGCIGSLIVSLVGSLVLILVLRGCGAF